MIIGSNFALQIFLNETELPIDGESYSEFKIIEDLNTNIYNAELVLKGSIWFDMVFLTGEDVRVELIYAGQKFVYNFIVFEYKMFMEGIQISLAPKLFDTLYRLKLTTGYNGTINQTIQTICSNANIKVKTIDNVDTEQRLFLQLNETYFSVLKRIAKYIKGYLLYINKDDKIEFTSFDSLQAKQPKGKVPQVTMAHLEIDNASYALQISGGFGSTGYYFDWDNGIMKTYESKPTQYGVQTKLIDTKNNIQMLAPIAKGIYFNEKYNKNQVDNIVLYKNIFKIFCTFQMTENFMDIYPLDHMQLMFNDKYGEGTDVNPVLSDDKWYVYKIITRFNTDATSEFTYARPFFNVKESNFTI